MKLTKSAVLGAATAAVVADASFIAAAPAQAYSGGGCSGWSSGVTGWERAGSVTAGFNPVAC